MPCGRTSSSRSSLDAENSEADLMLPETDENLLHRCNDKPTKPTAWKLGRVTFWASQSLLLVVIGLLIANLVICSKALQLSQRLALGGSKSNFTYLKYGSDLRYQTLDHRYDYLWDIDMEPTTGVVFFTSKDGQRTFGSIGMFHQLHCLASIRHTLQAAQEGKDIGRDWRDDDHWPHCMDYLRQAILCSADATIERPQIINGTATGGITGAYDVRECRNSEKLYNFREEYGVYKLGVMKEDN